MEVPLVGFRGRRSATTTDEIGETAIIRNESSSALASLHDLSFKIEVWLILVAIRAATGKRNRHELHPIDGRGLSFAVVRIKNARASDRYFKSQRRFVANGFH